jgi:PAS domain-containing protein
MTAATSKSEDQKVAEGKIEGFRKALGPFVVAAETTRMPMVFTDANDPGHPIIFVNDSFLSLTGYPRWELLGKNFDFLVVVEGDADPSGRSRLRSGAPQIAIRKSTIAARMAPSAGQRFSSARYGMKEVLSFSISFRLWMSASINKRTHRQSRWSMSSTIG